MLEVLHVSGILENISIIIRIVLPGMVNSRGVWWVSNYMQVFDPGHNGINDM